MDTFSDITLQTAVSNSGTYYIKVQDNPSTVLVTMAQDSLFHDRRQESSSSEFEDQVIQTYHPDTILTPSGSNASITSGIPIRGELETRDDKDVFSLVVEEGGHATITTDQPSNNGDQNETLLLALLVDPIS